MWKALKRAARSRLVTPVQRQLPAAAPPGDDKAVKNRAFFDDLWRQGDFWKLKSDPFERAKYDRQIQLIGDRRYAKILEIGCGAGEFTRLLAPLAERVVALDVSPEAIARSPRLDHVEFRAGNVMDYNPAKDGPFDLIVMSETIYYLGWLYTFFEVGWLIATLFDATADDGRFLMTNTYGGLQSYLHRPWLIRSYRDLFGHVGYRLDAEESFLGQKDDTQLEAMICLYTRPPGSAAVAV